MSRLTVDDLKEYGQPTWDGRLWQPFDKQKLWRLDNGMSVEPEPEANRLFLADGAGREVARQLYQTVVDLPIISPHGHVDPGLQQGYKAIRIQTGVPGLKSIYGIASNATFEGNKGLRYDHEPAQRDAFPAE